MRALAFCSILAVAVACASGKDAAESDARTAMDSVSQRADSAAGSVGPDSVADTADSVTPSSAAESSPASRPATGKAADEVSVTSTSAAVIGDSVVRRDSIIGRDSAFGPRYRIDSTGKLVPIRRP